MKKRKIGEEVPPTSIRVSGILLEIFVAKGSRVALIYKQEKEPKSFSMSQWHA